MPWIKYRRNYGEGGLITVWVSPTYSMNNGTRNKLNKWSEKYIKSSDCKLKVSIKLADGTEINCPISKQFRQSLRKEFGLRPEPT